MIFWGKATNVGIRVDSGYPHLVTVAAKNANGVGEREIVFTHDDIPDLQHLLTRAMEAIKEKSK